MTLLCDTITCRILNFQAFFLTFWNLAKILALASQEQIIGDFQFPEISFLKVKWFNEICNRDNRCICSE